VGPRQAWYSDLLTLPNLCIIGVMTHVLLTNTFPPDLKNIWNEEFAIKLADAQGALGGLNEAVSLLHNPNLLMRPLLDKEAESSTRLEGTQASVEDVYKSEFIENPDKKDDVAEVVNYQKALVHGYETIKERPLNQFLIKQLHKTLMSGVRGDSKSPGKYRKDDVWIGEDGTDLGDARYVPPSAFHVQGLMDNLFKLINDETIHPVIGAGLIHYQFEAIHPFKDGNGRTGRLLITLYLLKRKALRAPLLYPSGYFEKNRKNYVDALHSVDISQDWESWLGYFTEGIKTQAKLSLIVARDIDGLFKKHRDKVKNESAHLGLLQLLEYCFIQPYVTVSLIVSRLDIPSNTVRRYLDTLEEHGIIEHIDTHSRGQKIYANLELLSILRKI
jgi:Fic family protein